MRPSGRDDGSGADGTATGVAQEAAKIDDFLCR
jgi:hypothetical protein